MEYLSFKIENLLNELADGYPSTQRFSTMPIGEGGAAFRDPVTKSPLASRIKKEDVPNTLKQIYNLFDKFGLIDMDSIVPLGSTSYLTKPTMGDIDILVKAARPFAEIKDFKNTLYNLIYIEGYPIRDLAEKGRDFLYDMFTFLFPIINANGEITDEKVQVDVILAENDIAYRWRYNWYQGPIQSAWKGAARNILIGVIAKAQGYSWNKDGLYKSKIVNSGWEYETEEKITEDPDEAAQIVFNNQQLDSSVTESVETMLTWLEHEGASIRKQVLNDFNFIVSKNEAEGREMRVKETQK